MQVFIVLYFNLLFINSETTAVQAPQSPDAQPSFVPFRFC
ncbi:uncharacterized protein METZ01_LOCUS272706 [marine metagenome]|uniref:Uncharacterized protein n=1 Tax=marine metagenome TaxID=408172 RepID=A0A382K8V2_9ZZZZ